MTGTCSTADSVFRVVTPCGVGKQEKVFGIQVVQDPLVLRPIEINSPHRYRDHLCTRGPDGLDHCCVVRILSCPYQQARAEFVAADDEV